MTRPRPVKVTPAPDVSEAPPADAVVLFDGKDLSQWTQQARGGAAQDPTWKVENGYLEIVPRTGKLITKEKFGDCQLHVEWQIPTTSVGNGQGIGNSGVELMTRYEIQVLESNSHLTYADGGAGPSMESGRRWSIRRARWASGTSTTSSSRRRGSKGTKS